MTGTFSNTLLAFLILSSVSWGQDASRPVSDPSKILVDPSGQPSGSPSDRAPSEPGHGGPWSTSGPSRFNLGDKLCYYAVETYFNPAGFTGPAFRAGIRMANPPGKGATAYPPEWRQGAAAFGRNYGDAFVQRVTFQTGRFVAGAMTREDPRYVPSGRKNVLARSLYALEFTFADQSDLGHRMPAFSNFAGVAASGFVANAYLPRGFTDLTHAGQRATVQLGITAAGNLFREFAPQIPRPMRNFLMLIAR